MKSRRTILQAAFVAAIIASVLPVASTATAQEMKFLKIGTGGVGGTYYPIGGLIANAISNPPGSRACEDGGSCGVPNLVAIAQSANGSVANVNGIQSGQIDAGMMQSDVAYWAYTGTGVWKGRKPVKKLRLLAALYPESIQIVTRKDAGINSVLDLKDKHVSIDKPASGTQVDARIILENYGLNADTDIKPEFLKYVAATAKLKDGQIDAYFSVSGWPTSAIVDAVSTANATLVPIKGVERDAILQKYQFFSKDTIPATAYPGVPETETISVGAQLVVSEELDDELVYQVAKALWNDQTRTLLDKGHAKGAVITLHSALDGAGIPLHPGAERFYREAGLLN